ncbi:hypothetical protein [Haloprofundus salinisoli]|uniref:hypothetical protein n=1 Tax=Haloprofundus salinisoli TaxID=2876193 RepID=UPI001CCED1D4|nr:hypothetical protein [Haloprofundus salinisoli]
MVETDVTRSYPAFRYSVRFVPHALVLAVGSLSVSVAVGSVLAGLLGAWFPIQGGVPQLCLFLVGVVVSVLSTVAIVAEFLGFDSR